MRIEQLTFTRFIAAFAIVIFHFGREAFPFNYPFLEPTVLSLNIGVSYFFILSGFVIQIAYSNQKTISFFKFYILRIARIFPAFLISFFLSVFYLIYIGEKIDTFNFVTQLFLVHGWVKKYCLTINFPSWSLCVEILFYFIFPFFSNYFYKKVSIKKLTFFIITFWIISQSIFIFFQFNNQIGLDVKELSRYFPLMHLNQFLIGNLLALFFLKINANNRNNFFLISLCTGILILLINIPIPQIIFHDGLLAPIFCLIILLFSKDNSKFYNIFHYPIFILLGEISYGIYIYQYPVYKLGNFLYFNVLGFTLGTWTFYCNFILLIITSSISFKFIEKPIITVVKKKLKQKLN